MHAGLLRPDDVPAPAWPEVEQVAREMALLGDLSAVAEKASVALLVDPVSAWVDDIERQGAGYRYPAVVFQYYGALRALGVDVDIVSAGEVPLDGYKLIVAPALAMPDDATVETLRASEGFLLFGPRLGAKTQEFSISDGLPPGLLREFIPVKVIAVETLRPDCNGALFYQGECFESGRWRETIEAGDTDIVATYEDGAPAVIRSGRSTYVATLTDDAFLKSLLVRLCAEADVAVTPLPPTLRLRRRGALSFAFNLSDQSAQAPAREDAEFVIGGRQIEPFGVSVWR
jgi:beta-galactosidase